LALDLMSNVSLKNDAIVSSKTMKLCYKRDNDKFYLDDKYFILSTKNTLSQIEVIKSFKRIGQQRENNYNEDDESVFGYLFYMLFFCIQLKKNKIEVTKLYYEAILLLFKIIKEKKID